MNCIDFSGSTWGGFGRACGGTADNSFIDETNGVTLIIEYGSMSVRDSDGNRILFFSTANCQEIIQPSTELTIRFNEPQERVTFQFSFQEPDKPNPAPALINFYRTAGNQTDANRARWLSIDWVDNRFFEVSYDNCCDPIQEITIRTDRLENALDDLCWGLSYTRNSYWGPATCFFCKYLRIFFNLLRAIKWPWVPISR